MRSAVPADRASRRRRPRTSTARTLTRRAGWLAALGIAIALWLLAAASSASAHAVFVSASPAPGASLTQSPTLLRIVFSEPLVPKLSSIALHASSNATVPATAAGVDPHDQSAYELRLPRLKPDRYTVIWHTTSRIDGHVRWGSYAFTVLEPDGAAPPSAASAGGLPPEPAQLPTQVQAAASWAGLAGLFLITGTTLMLLLGAAARPATRRRLGRLLAAGGLGALVGVLGQFAAVWAGAGWQGSALTSVLGDGVAGWLWLGLGAVAVALVAWPRGGKAGGWVRQVVLVAAALALVTSFATTGHGAASARPVAGTAFLAVHVLAASVWLGGVLGLATVWGLARRHGTSTAERRVLLRRFSLVAGMAVPAVAASGAASALLELGSITDFVRSEYAITLLAKLAVAAAVGVAAVSNVRLHRRGLVTDPARAGRVRAGLWAEAGLGLLILVPTATMSVLAPAGPADAARAAGQRLQAASDPAAAFTGTGTLGARGLELSLTPGNVGTNAVTAEVDGTNPATHLRLQLAGAAGAVMAELSRTGYDHDPQTHTIYQGTIGLSTAGTWNAVVGGPAGSSQPILVPLRTPSAGVPAASASPPRLDDWLLAIAVLGAAGIAIGASRYVRGQRRRGASFAFAGGGVVAALVAITALSIATPSATSGAVASPWGVASRVSPTSEHGATTWPVGASGAGLMMPAIGPDGSVWVGEMDTNALARLSPDRDEVQQFTLPGGYKEIMGVAVDDDNHVWIAEEHAQALGMFDPATGGYRQFPIPGQDPAPLGVAVDAQGDVWFTMMNGNLIGRFDPSAARFTEYPIPTAHALPYWLAVDPAGQVWFTEFGSGKLGALQPKTGKISEYPLPSGSSPAGIAVGRAGTVWATTTQGLLIRLDGRTAVMQAFRAPKPDDYGVAMDDGGAVWFGLASGSAVYAFDPGTAAFAEHQLPAGSAPWWVAAGQGHVWVALSSDARGGLSELDAVS